MEKLLGMHKANNTDPKILEKLIRYSKREKGNPPKPDDSYKIKKKSNSNEV